MAAHERTLRDLIKDEAHLAVKPTQSEFSEVLVALGFKSSPSTVKRKERRGGDGYSADEVIAVARHWSINPSRLLALMGFLTDQEVAATIADDVDLTSASDYDLAAELMGRLAPLKVRQAAPAHPPRTPRRKKGEIDPDAVNNRDLL